MKKLILSLVLIALAVIVTACASDRKSPYDDIADGDRTIDNTVVDGSDDNSIVPETSGDADAAVITLADGTSITLGGGAEDVISALGDYSDVFEAPSCVHEGYDKFYTYSGYSVTTSPDENGVDRVTELSIDSSDCSLDNGITIGSTIGELQAAYGTDCSESFGVIAYDLGKVTLTAVTDGENVTALVFTLK